MSFRLHQGSKRASGYGVLAFVVTFGLSIVLVRDTAFSLICAGALAVLVFEWIALNDAPTNADVEAGAKPGADKWIE